VILGSRRCSDECKIFSCAPSRPRDVIARTDSGTAVKEGLEVIAEADVVSVAAAA